ncbi:MAG: DUF2493 domain-containing protein [Firmicutes bacterium]|nr:DUF2493 domain-containing protein [Bacillota bacterium]
MVVLVCGSRDYTDYGKVYDCLKSIDVSQVLAGGCRGADTLAVAAAKACGYPFREFPADWRKFGKAAGPIRNQQMLDEGKPDLVVAFHEDLENSKGTKDMIRRARSQGIPVRLIG